MDRRQYLQSLVSGVAGSLAGCVASNDQSPSPDHEHSETVAPETCEACADFKEFCNEQRFTPYAPDKAATAEHLLDPENHTWDDGCEYARSIEHTEWTEEQLLAVDYDITSHFVGGVLSVNVDFNLNEPLKHVETTVTVGDTSP